MDDIPGQGATTPDTSYALSVDDAATLYARAGHPRTIRSIQRYCASGHLDCVKESTSLGDKYFVDAGSVARHIAQIEELIALDNRAAGRVLSRHDATTVAPQASDMMMRQTTTPLSLPDASDPSDAGHFTEGDNLRQAPTPDGTSRPVATETTPPPAYVARLEREVEHLTEDKVFLREQIKTKDEQIGALLERDRETNILVRGLQQMLSPLLGSGRVRPSDDERMNG